MVYASIVCSSVSCCAGTKPPAGFPSAVWRVNAVCKPGHGLMVTTGQSLPNASLPPPCAILFQRKRAWLARRSGVLQPHFERVGVGVGVQWLHARDDSQLTEARDVCAEMVSMCSIRGRIWVRRRLLHVLVRVQGEPYGAIANRVGENLVAVLVEFRHRRLVLRGLPECLPVDRRVVGVRREHRRRVRFHYAVEHGLYRASREPIIVIGGACLVELFRFPASVRGVEEIGDVETRGEFALPAQLVVQIEVLEVATGAVNAGDAVAPCFSQAGPQAPSSAVRARAGALPCRTKSLGRFLERAGRVSLCIANDLSIRGIGRIAVDSRHLQRFAVGPRCMAVKASQNKPADR